MKYLVITIRFLSDRYHGRTENGREPEWPPSPLRLYQAVLAGAAPRWHDSSLRDQKLRALGWFQRLEPPRIIAPKTQRGRSLLTYVRENLSDIDPEKRDAKISRPTLFCGEPKLTYYWSIDPKDAEPANLAAGCARHCHALGWGVDMVVADAAVVEREPECTAGEKWLPTPDVNEDVVLRVPRGQSESAENGTISELMSRFSSSLKRLAEDGRDSVNPLRVFRTFGYRRATDRPPHSVAAFSLLKLDAGEFHAFDTAGRALTVAGMVRCAAKLAAEHSGGKWTEKKINAFVLGHGHSNDGGRHLAVGPQRFAYLPLPSIEGRGRGKARVVGSVRRVMLSCFAEGCEDEIAWARRMLSGQELVDKGSQQPVALLSLIPANEKVVRCYTQAATTWATVTPIVLPGYDDPDHLWRRARSGKLSSDQQRRMLERLSVRIDGLLRKAILQAGISRELADHAELGWRKVGFWPGTDLADRYGVPDHLKRFPRFHVKVSWRDARGLPLQVPGPVCFGGGRFYGLGLFAASGIES